MQAYQSWKKYQKYQPESYPSPLSSNLIILLYMHQKQVRLNQFSRCYQEQKWGESGNSLLGSKPPIKIQQWIFKNTISQYKNINLEPQTTSSLW